MELEERRARCTDEFFLASPLMGLVAGDGGRIERANPALCAALGYAEEELQATTVIELVDPADRALVAAALDALAHAKATSTFVCAARCKHGETRRLRFHCSRSPDGAFLYASALDAAEPPASARGGAAAPAAGDAAPPDVSDPSHLPEQLLFNEQLLRMVLDNVPLVLWAVDMEGFFTKSDGLGLRGLGLAAGQVVGMNLFELYAGAPDVVAGVKRAMGGEMSFSTTEVGGVIWDTRYMPMVDRSGRRCGVVGLGLDVTERSRTEQELRRRLEVIEAQRGEIRAMSMPIIQVADGVLALPVVGAIDAQRAAHMMETVLHAVVTAGARHVIIDLTGVEDVEESSADHLLRLVQALSLVGATAVVAGIQPRVASIMTSLGPDFSRIVAAGNLKDAIRLCTRAAR